MRYIYIGTLALIVALTSAVALIFGKSPYYPVVRAQIPGGVVLTIISQPLSGAEKCSAANEKTVSAMRARCPQCSFVLISCPTRLEDLWNDAMSDRVIGVYAVHSETQRILIDAPGEIAQQICISSAQQITLQEKQHGHCVAPNTRP